MSPRDLLADKLLAHGDPDEDEVRQAAPPMDSAKPERGARSSWNTIVGTRECSDTMPVYPGGNTRTYHPTQYFKELTQERVRNRLEGLIGGWMPAVRKVVPGDDNSYCEIVVFGDILSSDSSPMDMRKPCSDSIASKSTSYFSTRMVVTTTHAEAGRQVRVSGVTGDGATFCIPAQQTIPPLVRWMLVFEDPDEDRLYQQWGSVACARRHCQRTRASGRGVLLLLQYDEACTPSLLTTA
jgi:hypothetical protein